MRNNPMSASGPKMPTCTDTDRHMNTQDLVSKMDRVEILLTKMYESWLKLGKVYANDH